MSSDSDVGLRPVKGEGKEGLGRNSLRSWHSREKVLARPMASAQAKDACKRNGPALISLACRVTGKQLGTACRKHGLSEKAVADPKRPGAEAVSQLCSLLLVFLKEL